LFTFIERKVNRIGSGVWDSNPGFLAYEANEMTASL